MKLSVYSTNLCLPFGFERVWELTDEEKHPQQIPMAKAHIFKTGRPFLGHQLEKRSQGVSEFAIEQVSA